MALGLTEEHLDLAAAIRGWAQRNCPPEVMRAAANGPDSGSERYLESLRPGLAEQGVLGLHLPEEHRGQGYGLPELAVALEELGRALLPGAYLPTVFASAALVTEGEAAPVLGASLADLVIAGVQTDRGEVWAAIDAASLQITRLDSLDLTRPVALIRADGIALPADRLLTGLDRGAVTSLAAILFGAEAAGLADWATQTAADYAKIRHQFGRPIGQFQAVKHRCAWMLTAAEQAAAVVWDAASTRPDGAADEAQAGRQREYAASVAAVVAIDAAVSCAHECIQVLGGIGYTWEHDAHLYYRRAMSLRALLGPSDQWARRVAELALGGVRRPVQVELPDS